MISGWRWLPFDSSSISTQATYPAQPKVHLMLVNSTASDRSLD